MNTKRWLIMFAVILVLSAAAWIITTNIAYESSVATIYQDGVIYREIDLSGVVEPYEFTLHGDDGSFNTVHVDIGWISMASASCPDQICVHHDPISDGAQPIVCLPNKVIIQIEKSKDDKVDAVGG